MDPLNEAQPWEDFQRLVTYVVSIDSIVGGLVQNQKKSPMKFTNGREIDNKLP